MVDVMRFWCHEANNIRCVRESDFDAALAREAALREELAQAAHMRTFWAESAAEQRNAELVELLRETRELIRPTAVLSPGGDSAQLKSRLDKALLNSPAAAPPERIAGCADAAWLLYDKGLYGQHGVLVMDTATILQKAISYAGYKPTESGASE